MTTLTVGDLSSQFRKAMKNMDGKTDTEVKRILLALIEEYRAKRKMNLNDINRIIKTFHDEFISAMARAMGTVTSVPIDAAMMASYQIGGVTLSSILYKHAADVGAEVAKVINDHLMYKHNVNKLALSIYEGYGFNPSEPLKPSVKLPKYMQNAALDKQVKTALAKIGKLNAGPLKASYLDALNKIVNKKSQASVERALKVAIEERYRYFAKRIARTELFKAHVSVLQRRYMSDDKLEYLQVRLSSKHPRRDICDYHAGVDLYGLGAGVYPKAACPKPPFHPHCYCMITPRLDLVGVSAQYDEKASKDYLKTLSPHDAALVAGSKAKAEIAQKAGIEAAETFG
jgi:hypothetical protein